MTRFNFKANKSFLSYLHRPLTIPRGQISYRVFEDEGLASEQRPAKP
jgi:hypothetical protein